MAFTRSFAILALVVSLVSTAAQAAEPSCPGGYSPQFRLNGQVQNPARFRLVDLQYRRLQSSQSAISRAARDS